jgi:hypothetical protein
MFDAVTEFDSLSDLATKMVPVRRRGGLCGCCAARCVRV